MHYPPFTAVKIVSPYPIGAATGLSHGDMSAIDFMYNGCSESYTAPTCLASLRVGKTHMIPHSRVWFVVFTAKYATPMSVTHTDDVPGDSVSYSSIVERHDPMRYEQVLFTPTAAHAGKTYTISATFTADGVSTTCTVQVRVADSDTMCFGLAASDPGVCSGRGTCTTNAPYPCVCHEGYGGADCSGFANCPSNRAFTFDGGLSWWARRPQQL